MNPGTHNIEIYQGATYKLNAVVKDSEGIAKDLTGYSGRGAIKRKATDIEEIVEFTVIVAQDNSGEVTVSLTDEETSDIPTKGNSYKEVEKYFYDVEIFKTGEVVRLLQGLASVSPEITK
jgi:hypothetical protein